MCQQRDNFVDPSINWVGGQEGLSQRSFRSREGSFGLKVSGGQRKFPGGQNM